jgi:signal transduction histidine kinase
MDLQPEPEKPNSIGGGSDFADMVAMNLYRAICLISLQMVKVRVSQIMRLVPYSLRLLSNGLSSERSYICTADKWLTGEYWHYWTKNPDTNGGKIEIEKISQRKMIDVFLKDGTIVFIGNASENDVGPGIIDDSRIKCFSGTPEEIHIPLHYNNKMLGILSFDMIHRCLHHAYRMVHPFRIISVLIANLLVWTSEQSRGFGKTSGTRSLSRSTDSMKEIDVLKKTINLKNSILSTVSHELRTPLTGIISLTQALRMTNVSLSEQEKETFLGIIENEGKRLAALIRELLDFSMVEMDEMVLTFTDFRLCDLVKEVTVLLAGISYVQMITIDVDNTVLLHADKNRIKQVLIILLDNAIKYGQTPCRIAATVVGDTNQVIISVADNGSGIIIDEQKKIFDSFYRTASHGKNKPEGTGLGLAIAKKIVESHGGTIWVESVPGQGSTFFFSLSTIKN